MYGKADLFYFLCIFLSSQAGVLWHLVLQLFGYDFTLDESSVERDEKTHQQVSLGDFYSLLLPTLFSLCCLYFNSHTC